MFFIGKSCVIKLIEKGGKVIKRLFNGIGLLFNYFLKLLCYILVNFIDCFYFIFVVS